jgi:hypothetical protein
MINWYKILQNVTGTPNPLHFEERTNHYTIWKPC